MASSYEDRKAKVDTIMALTSVQEQLTSVLPTVASRSHGVTDAVYSLLLQSAACESPLEAIFVGWWIGISWLFNDANGSREITLSPQVDVRCGTDRYRLDFQVTLADRSGYYAQAEREHRLTYPLIGIELDGHDFHERTKEQVAYRDRRDRALQIAGWRVFHISGSELYRRGYEAVSDVYEHAHDEWVELHAAIYHAGR